MMDEVVNAIMRNLALDEGSYLDMVHQVQEISNYECYEGVVNAFHECVSFTDVSKILHNVRFDLTLVGL
jgi:hypothetical protein